MIMETFEDLEEELGINDALSRCYPRDMKIIKMYIQDLKRIIRSGGVKR